MAPSHTSELGQASVVSLWRYPVKSLLWDTRQAAKGGGGFFDVRGVKIPVAVTVFPDEIYAAPRSWAEGAYPKLIYYNKLDRGGYFAAWEQPELFTAEQRAAFRPLRKTLGEPSGAPSAA